MTELLHTLGPFINWLIASGVLAGAYRALLSAIRKRRAGVSVRDGKRRLDLVGQRAAAVAYIYALREYCIAHGTAPADLPPLPDFLKEPT